MTAGDNPGYYPPEEVTTDFQTAGASCRTEWCDNSG